MPKTRKTPKVSTETTPTFAIAIMAAGKGTRLKSRHPKVLHQVGGKPMLAYVVAAASRVVPPGAPRGERSETSREQVKIAH